MLYLLTFLEFDYWIKIYSVTVTFYFITDKIAGQILYRELIKKNNVYYKEDIFVTIYNFDFV